MDPKLCDLLTPSCEMLWSFQNFMWHELGDTWEISVMVVFVCICFPPIPGAKLQIYEDGFHSSILVNKNGREALGFLKLLKLDDEVVSANIEASARRHLLHRGHVSLVPGPQHVLLYGPAFLAEPLWPRSKEEDESVYDFVKRRGSKSLALRLADPICRGQLVGNAKELSVRSSFPRLWHNEKRFGSVFLGVSTLGRSHESWIGHIQFHQFLPNPPRLLYRPFQLIANAVGWHWTCWTQTYTWIKFFNQYGCLKIYDETLACNLVILARLELIKSELRSPMI